MLKPNDLEVLKDFLLERMPQMDAWLVLSAAKHPDAHRVLVDRPITNPCPCGAWDGIDDEYGLDPGNAHGAECALVAALKQLDHPNLQRVINDDRRHAEQLYEERDRGYHPDQVSTAGMEPGEHWVVDTETVYDHDRRRGALLHPSVIAARRAGASQEDIDDIIETLIERDQRGYLLDDD